MADLELQMAPLLARAGDELRAGHLPAAHAILEEAERLAADDPRTLNLRALYFFRSQRFEDAHRLYLSLVEKVPDDPALFLNLGLVELKLERFSEAAVHLQRVVDKDPSDQRAQSYLGLARLRSGDANAASVAFSKAGRDELAQNLALHAQRQDALHKRDELRLAARDGDVKLSGDQPFGPVESEPKKGPATDLAQWQVRDPGQPAPLPSAEGTIAPAIETKSTSPLEGALPVAAFATQRLLQIPDGEPFGLGEGGFLIIRVDGQQATRTTGALVSTGTLAFSPLMRRVRGQATDEPFGDGGEAMMAAEGKGILVFQPGEDAFTVLDLAEDILYLRETELFAFDLGLHWESGRIPGRAGDPVRIVQVRGTGRLVLRTKRKIYTLKTEADGSLFVDARALCGWIGRVVPRFVNADGQPTNLIDCAGEGVLILAEP